MDTLLSKTTALALSLCLPSSSPGCAGSHITRTDAVSSNCTSPLSISYHSSLYLSSKDEDYRWAILRSQLPTWFFQFTNLTFIAGIQNILLLLLGMPAFVAAVLQPHIDICISDYALAVIALTVLGFEFVADNQQYAFQTYKHAYLAHVKGDKGEPYDEKKQWPLARLDWTPSDARRGFITKGLWRYSRHPNFACEQTFWVCSLTFVSFAL